MVSHTFFSRVSLLLFVLLSLATAPPAIAQALLSGQITDPQGEALIGVNVLAGNGLGSSTDAEGHYRLELDAGNYEIEFSYVGYQNQTREVQLNEGQKLEINIKLSEATDELGILVVSGSLYEKKLEEEVVSIEVLGSDYIERTASRSLDQAVNRLAGVYLADGQINMRGGTGYSFGVGSRVMMVVDGQPLLSADRGDVKWSMIPMENIEQVEVIKGASSVLYGSGALNGVVHVRTAWPGIEPETKIVVYQGLYGNPKREELKWWDSNPIFYGGRFSHAQRFGNFDLVVGGSAESNQSYIREELREHARLNFKTRYRPKKFDGRLSFGLNGNSHYFNEGLFLLWDNANEGAYVSMPGADDMNSYLWSTLDPWVTYFDKGGNRHSFKGRYYHVASYFSANNRAAAKLLNGDYQFQKRFKKDASLTVGASNMGLIIRDKDIGDWNGNLLSIFAQADKEWGARVTVNAGMRWESFSLDTVIVNALPVFRGGLSVRVSPNNWIRASFGQGFRFPSITERFVNTEIAGTIKVLPNPDLRPEIGWNAEIGSKQVFNGLNWKGYLDAALFLTEYTDMTEFLFGIYPDGLGFKNENVGPARIAGLEVAAQGTGFLGRVPLTVQGGWTYCYPADLTIDNSLTNAGNYIRNWFANFDGDDPEVAKTLLRYRFRHIAKLDVEAGFDRFRIGVNVQYFSFMDRIDDVFNYFITGVEDFRAAREGQGDLILGGRMSYEVTSQSTLSLQIQNGANREYSLRPGRMDAPRTYTLQYRIVL